MRKLITTLFLCSSVLAFSQNGEKPKVVATASIFADMASVIGGNLIEVRSVVPVGGDPHIYEPTPSDATLVAEADLILKNGLTFEGWLLELIENSGTKAPSILITEGIEPISSLVYENATDPHAWMDAQNGLTYIENIKNALIDLDPDNRDIYQYNYDLYRQQLLDLDQFIEDQIQRIPEKRRILITSHDAFQYYGRRYGLQLESVLGTSTDAEVQTADIVRLNKVIQENEVPAVFIESTINPKLLEQLARDNKVVVGGQLFADSIGDKDSAAPSYIDMLKHNTLTIVEALSQSGSQSEELQDRSSKSGGRSYWLLAFLGLLLIGGLVLVIQQNR